MLKQELLADLKKRGIHVVTVADRIGISTNTFYYHAKKEPIETDFLRLIEDRCNIRIITGRC